MELRVKAFTFLPSRRPSTGSFSLRRRILDEIPPARVRAFRDRLEMMHRLGWQGRRARSAVAYAWFVWDLTHTGPTIITRISARADRDRSASTPTASETGDAMSKPKLHDVNAPAASEDPDAKLSITKPDAKFDLSRFKSKRTVKMANVGVIPTQLDFIRIADANDFVRLQEEEYWSDE